MGVRASTRRSSGPGDDASDFLDIVMDVSHEGRLTLQIKNVSDYIVITDSDVNIRDIICLTPLSNLDTGELVEILRECGYRPFMNRVPRTLRRGQKRRIDLGLITDHWKFNTFRGTFRGCVNVAMYIPSLGISVKVKRRLTISSSIVC
jgi:hypothetical protein